MLHKLTWRFWAALAALLAIYTGAGFALAHNGRFDGDFYTTGLCVAFAAPVLFVATYTAMGKKWWRNDLGTNLVMLGLAAEPENFGLAWTFLFNHGMLTTTWLAWITIGGPWWTGMVLLWRFAILLRVNRDERNGNGQPVRSDEGKP